MPTRRATTSIVATMLLALTGCSVNSDAAERPRSRPSPATTTATTPLRAPPTPAASEQSETPAAAPAIRPVRATRFWLSIPDIGLRRHRVIAYTGSPDDAPGTRIQNRGDMATPRGPGGGARPGEVGNLIVTGHRLTAGGPLRDLPELRRGARILVTADGMVYDYRVTTTMTISFRSARSRALQSAPVPGHPGEAATRPMITVSTCATPEDRAAGNNWSDRFGNPEHRIDKVGVLVDVRAA